MSVLRYLHHAVDPEAPPLAPQAKRSSPYKTIGCVFNHHTFLANCQPSDAVELCVFDLQVRGLVSITWWLVASSVISLQLVFLSLVTEFRVPSGAAKPLEYRTQVAQMPQVHEVSMDSADFLQTEGGNLFFSNSSVLFFVIV